VTYAWRPPPIAIVDVANGVNLTQCKMQSIGMIELATTSWLVRPPVEGPGQHDQLVTDRVRYYCRVALHARCCNHFHYRTAPHRTAGGRCISMQVDGIFGQSLVNTHLCCINFRQSGRFLLHVSYIQVTVLIHTDSMVCKMPSNLHTSRCNS
jgi:hypothetical protein